MAEVEGKGRVDHDQKMKAALTEFWRELVGLFLSWLGARLSGEVEWLTQEVFTNPPFGLTWRLDLVARVGELREGAERLLDVEVESATSLTEVRKKIAHYYPVLRAQRNRRVTVLALYLKVGLDGLGWDRYVERDDEGQQGDEEVPPEQTAEGEEVFGVRWRYVGLPALPAWEYLRGGNWLGVALSALMKVEKGQEVRLRAEILRRLAVECEENDYRKLLLIDLVDTYMPLEGDLLSAYDELVAGDPDYQEAKRMILSTYDRLLLEGQAKALREVILDLASSRCGEPDEATREKVEQIEDVPRLRALYKGALAAASWGELLDAK